jgi:hypothetical protein
MSLELENMTQLPLEFIVMKIEIDLIRDLLKNIFIVMFAIMSGEVSLIYKIFHNEYNVADFILIILGLIVLSILIHLKNKKSKNLKLLIKRLEE